MIVGFMFFGLVGLILLNVPIAIALGSVAMAAMVYSGGIDALLLACLDSSQPSFKGGQRALESD